MKRDIGLYLWTFGPIAFEEKCKYAAEIEVDGVEVEGDITQSVVKLKEILNKYYLCVLSVTPRNVDISSSNEEVRGKAVKYFYQLITWAKELRADLGRETKCLSLF